MMSADSESSIDEEMMSCASCGIAAVDNVKLKRCACDLVKYCSVACQKNHRPHHKKACKKRMTEIRDDELFAQPNGSCYGECPICCLALPLGATKRTIMACCCNIICLGCDNVNQEREREQGLDRKCAFCREPLPKTQTEADRYVMKRVKANDPFALTEIGKKCYSEGDCDRAFGYFTKAAALGHMDAHYKLAGLYLQGHGVEEDPKKKMHHLEIAAIGGHPMARCYIGGHEHRNGRVDRAIKHYIIAANLGDDDALNAVKKGFARGIFKKDDNEAALRGHQAAVDATKSQQREEAYKDEFYKRN